MFCPKGLRVWMQTQPPSRSQLYQASAGRLEVLQAHTKSVSRSEPPPREADSLLRQPRPPRVATPARRAPPLLVHVGAQTLPSSLKQPHKGRSPSPAQTLTTLPLWAPSATAGRAVDCFPSASGAQRGTGASGGLSPFKL